jgi:hypothetical protein
MHCAGADFVDRSDVPTEMMVPGCVRAREGDHVVIAAVDAVQERNVVAGMVGQTHAEHARVEIDRFGYVAREQQDMSEPSRARAWQRAAEWGPALARAGRLERKMRLFVWR